MNLVTYETLYSVLGESVSDLFWIKDRNGVYLDCNSKFSSFFAVDTADVIGKTDTELLDGDILNQIKAEDFQILTSGKGMVVEHRISHRFTRQQHTFEMQKTPLLHEDGTVVGILGVACDVSTKRELEIVMEETQNPEIGSFPDQLALKDFFELGYIQKIQDQLARAMSVNVILVDVRGEPITQASTFSRNELFGIDPLLVGNENNCSGFGQNTTHFVDEKNVIDFKIGENCIAKWIIDLPIESATDVAGVFSTIAEELSRSIHQNLMIAEIISDQKQHEHKMLRVNRRLRNVSSELGKTNFLLKEALRKAEESDRLKSAFLANVSHEIRTPLNAILGLTSIFQDGIFDDDEMDNYLDMINDSGQALLNLVSNLLVISQMDAGIKSPELMSFDLHAMLRKLVSIHQTKIKVLRKINVQLFLSDYRGNQKVSSDPELVYQILDNLIYNAVKYTDEGLIEIQCSVCDASMHFTISDTGIGLSEDMQARVFERFFQMEPAEKRFCGGLGLGLSLVKSCLNHLGGEISIESEHRVGTTIRFSIPDRSGNCLNGILFP